MSMFGRVKLEEGGRILYGTWIILGIVKSGESENEAGMFSSAAGGRNLAKLDDGLAECGEHVQWLEASYCG